MEIKADNRKRRILKFRLFFVLFCIIAIGFVSVVLLFNHGSNGFVGFFFGFIMIFCIAALFPYLIFLTRGLELLATQKIFYSEKNLIFYFSQRDGSPDSFGQLHFYDRRCEIKKIRKGRNHITVKGRFQTKTEGYPVLEIQNPDEEKSKLTFDEQVDLIYFEGSYIKNKKIRIMRVFTEEQEKILLEMLEKKT